MDVYRARRERIAARIRPHNGVLLLHGGALRTRSNDTEFPFRPDSDFHYLTGLCEPGAIAVVRSGRTPEEDAFVLFVRKRDRDAEIWSGRRVGPQGAMERYGATEAHPLSALGAELPKLLDGAGAVHVALGRWPALDRKLLAGIEFLWRRNRTGKRPPSAIHDARHLLGEERIVKDPAALASLRKAVSISAAGHREAMARVHPGMHEYEIEALLNYEFRRSGGTGPGYGSIVGGGDNATILHYVDNQDALKDGELLLVDAGAEWDYFSGDITRTYPVNGQFTGAQRELYEVVLRANEVGIDKSVVGSNIDAVHQACLEVLVDGMRALGLVTGSRDEVIETKAYEAYYMHRTSHWLGVDVHDAGAYSLDGSPRALEEGFVFTVEPGLYVAADAEDAPEELRGTGIRVEDDVLITAQGPEVLSADCPKTVTDLEALVGSRAGSGS
jgi:Xaa-Pro aminopeptidase